jgi:hypothetical protein
MSITATETPTQRAQRLARETADAYSFDAYGARQWFLAAKGLVDLGYSDAEVEAILRSKWTRWARDAHSSYEGKGQWVIDFVLMHEGEPGYLVGDLL